MRGNRSVTIDAFPASAYRHLERDAIVCIDVLLSTTSLIASVSKGRSTYAAANLEGALDISRRLSSPIMGGEQNGSFISNFEINNSPTEIVARDDIWRPLVLVSSPGTELIDNSSECPAVYLASLQNFSVTAEYLASRHDRIAVLGAGGDGEFRCEDQMAAAWLTNQLVQYGFKTEDMRTSETVERWCGTDVSLVSWGNSAANLRSSGQDEDLEFVLDHVDDLDCVCCFLNGEVVSLSGQQRSSRRTVATAMLSPRPTTMTG